METQEYKISWIFLENHYVKNKCRYFENKLQETKNTFIYFEKEHDNQICNGLTLDVDHKKRKGEKLNYGD